LTILHLLFLYLSSTKLLLILYYSSINNSSFAFAHFKKFKAMPSDKAERKDIVPRHKRGSSHGGNMIFPRREYCIPTVGTISKPRGIAVKGRDV
jgi:hypothetical protein